LLENINLLIRYIIAQKKRKIKYNKFFIVEIYGIIQIQIYTKNMGLNNKNIKFNETKEDFYFEIIKRKTAKLFEVAAQLGALIASDKENEIAANISRK
jgi:geranylgeranyl pyrophosphate synthase